MRRSTLCLVLVAVLLMVAVVAPGAAAERLIFVTSNGWHSGIVVARADLPEAAIPEIADFPDAVFFEFGWGDAAYYPARRPTFDLAMRAALPGPAVVHLLGLIAHPSAVFPTATVEAVRLS